VLAVTDMVAPDYHWVAITYAVESFEGEPAIQEAHAIHEWGWFALDALPSPMTAGASTPWRRSKRRSQALP
jgi:8-oxo-dGTP diphosphatase